MVQRARAIADSLRRPFLLSILTLSSHDPYTIPATPLYPGRDGEPAFLSAHHYTDATLGAFIASLHASPLWDSTLVIILGDHGHLMPVLDASTGRFAPSSFHIPMLWLGGALAVHDTVVHTLASQVDLAPTLLAQLGLPTADFPWGRDLLAHDYRPMAFYAFQDGFGLLTRHGNAAYDNAARRVLAGPVGPLDSTALRIGMALQQRLMDDYVAR
jgi:phosphoglycerol transferase MdoB-like AlkP superfamily enzyme